MFRKVHVALASRRSTWSAPQAVDGEGLGMNLADLFTELKYERCGFDG